VSEPIHLAEVRALEPEVRSRTPARVRPRRSCGRRRWPSAELVRSVVQGTDLLV